MRANYHTHTARCGHAVGEDREYVEQAIGAGLEILGFSDHTPYPFDEPGAYPNVRMRVQELPEYCDAVNHLRAEYAGRLEIHLGLETEYYPRYFPRLLETLRQNQVEYLLLAQHFLGNEIGEPYCGVPTEDPRVLDRYVGQSMEAMQTGVFSYFAHPDLINFQGSAREYTRQMRRLCQTAREQGMPLEINLQGLREGRQYPCIRFWRIAGEEGCSAVLGCDAHEPKALRVPNAVRRGQELAKRFSVRLLEKIPLRAFTESGSA